MGGKVSLLNAILGWLADCRTTGYPGSRRVVGDECGVTPFLQLCHPAAPDCRRETVGGGWRAAGLEKRDCTHSSLITLLLPG